MRFFALSRAHERWFWIAAPCCFPPRKAPEEERCTLALLLRRLLFALSPPTEPRKGQGGLPKPQGHGLFHGKSQGPRCATPGIYARYRSRRESENAPLTTINLGKLLASSMLTESGGFGSLPSQPILAQNTDKQRKAFGLAKANLTSESAEMVRSTTAVTDNPPSQPLQTAAATTARESAATRNNENRGNSGNNENRGNAGNNENRGNAGNNENRGNLRQQREPRNKRAITRTGETRAIARTAKPGQ